MERRRVDLAIPQGLRRRAAPCAATCGVQATAAMKVGRRLSCREGIEGEEEGIEGEEEGIEGEEEGRSLKEHSSPAPSLLWHGMMCAAGCVMCVHVHVIFKTAGTNCTLAFVSVL
ncbi:hypothetical protein VPH35_076674 [Triticum aestivum]|uniref:Uncharacterized protein n=1 Tax=Aegilops tauschii subsp. strangulata TaxID=200361 RepID=A0A453HB07_AEGTS